jgi:hypothetical protein
MTMSKIIDLAEQFKAEAVNQIADVIPWLAFVPSAYFVGDASLTSLGVPPGVAVSIAVTIEGLGITLIDTTMEFYRWNLQRMRKEFKAPVVLAGSFVGVYLVATVGLTVVLKIVPDLSTFAPALFPLLALTGAAQLVLRAQHIQRMADKGKAYSKDKDGNEQKGAGAVQALASEPDKVSEPTSILAPILSAEQRRERLLALWAQGEGANFATLAPDFGVSRQTISNDFAVLAQRGKVRRNDGQGIEVIAVPEGDL